MQEIGKQFKHCPILSFGQRNWRHRSRDAVETKLCGMKIKEILEVGSPIVIIKAQPMFKTTKPMPMMQPNTGRLKLGHAHQYFFPNIYEHGFYFPLERTLLSFYNANLFAKAQCVFLRKENP